MLYIKKVIQIKNKKKDLQTKNKENNIISKRISIALQKILFLTILFEIPSCITTFCLIIIPWIKSLILYDNGYYF